MGRKRRTRIVLLMVGAVVVVLAGTLAVVLTGLRVNTATQGASIEQYATPRSALLVIDVQNDITSNTGRYGDTDGFVGAVNQAITVAETRGMETLYVKNVYGNNPIIWLLSGGKFRAGSEGAELDGHLMVLNDNVFTKSVGDSFSSPALEDYLISHSVDTLYVVGADAAACVYATAQGGMNRGYAVNIVKDAIITLNDATLNQMLTRYEAEGITVTDLAHLM